MGWTKVGETGAAIAAGAGTQDITLPGTPIQWDLVLVATAADVSCQNVITTSGYTVPQNGTGANPGANFGYKVMGSTPDTVVTLDQDATILRATVVQVWRGGDHSVILDAAWPTAATGTSNAPDPPTVTTVTHGALVCAVAFLDDDDSTVSTYPSGYADGISQNTGQASTTVGATVAICSQVEASPAAEDPGAYTMSSTDAWTAGTIAFKAEQFIVSAMHSMSLV